MKNSRFLLIIISVAVFLMATAIVLTNCTHEEVSFVGVDKTIPPIDLNRPSVTETATFALG